MNSSNPLGGFNFTDDHGTSVMKITDMKVGIGTTLPEETLHVVGNSKFDGKVILEPQGDIPMFGQ